MVDFLIPFTITGAVGSEPLSVWDENRLVTEQFTTFTYFDLFIDVRTDCVGGEVSSFVNDFGVEGKSHGIDCLEFMNG